MEASTAHACAWLQASFMENKGDMRVKAGLSWIMFSNKMFCEQYGYSLEVFEGWREQWLQSERAKEYGLDKPRIEGVDRMNAARQRGNKARVAARRKQALGGAD